MAVCITARSCPLLCVFSLLRPPVRIAWAVLASHAWDAGHGLVRVMLHNSVRVIFYSLGYFESAASYTLFTMVAKFWAELASAARQGTIAARPLGGGDEYR